MAHILLVDDDEDLRDAIQGFLDDRGYAAVTARNGAHALEVLAASTLPDVAVVDAYMLVMDGVELIERMRADPRFAKIPVIMISASTTIRPPSGTTLLSKVGLRDTLLRAIDRARAALAVGVATT